jgi:hypothetical protein
LVALLAGCGREEARVTVRGTVRLHGQVVAGGSIVFVPETERGTPDEMPVAAIQPDGSYQLRTENGLMIAPGWYRVTVTGGPRSPLPARYCDPEQSGLTREVRLGGPNRIDLDLE